MPIVPTPAEGKQITDYTAGVFDGASLLYQSKGGTGYKVSGDDVAGYVVANKVYPAIGNYSIIEGIGKPLTGTLTAGQTSLTLSDVSIDSTITTYRSRVRGRRCTATALRGSQGDFVRFQRQGVLCVECNNRA